MKKLTVTFPDGAKGSRRTPRPYTWVIASRLDKARPERDRVKCRYEECPEGLALAATFRAEFDALWRETRTFGRRATDAEIAASHRAWDAGFAPIHVREIAAYAAHRATCPKGCEGNGTIRIEISRKPEPTGWRPVSWHHSRALAEKALATSYTDWKTRGYDEVRIFPVDGTEAAR